MRSDRRNARRGKTREAAALFRDRREAGERLAKALESLRGRPVVVLGIPRGGVEIGAVVANALDAELDVVIPRKVGAPGNPELGLGAVAEGVQVLDDRLVRMLAVREDYLKREIEAQEEEIRRRSAAYRADRPPLNLSGKVAVVVDDGVATGGTAVAALRWAGAQGADKVVLAVPVAPKEAVKRLQREANDVHVLATPEPFYAVGQWYEDFPQVSDERVVELLAGRAGEAQ
ncbi:MAG TPA: phosphoribosyltransferase family protein [Actinomycetota bacterium]|nr:phosphoribosyltransferase family protein [Actinomycetota bacterium]